MVDAKDVAKLRKETGAPMMDCKKALQEANGAWDQAKDILRKKGLQAAEKRAGRDAAEGRVFSYIHAGAKIGVLVEVDCETDFVAKNEDFATFGHDLCLHVAANLPSYLDRESVPADAIEKERSFLLEQVQEQMGDRPPEIQEKTVEGRMSKFFKQHCLLEQDFVKENSKSVEEVRKEMVAKIGENLVIKRFAAFVVGGE